MKQSVRRLSVQRGTDPQGVQQSCVTTGVAGRQQHKPVCYLAIRSKVNGENPYATADPVDSGTRTQKGQQQVDCEERFPKQGVGKGCV